MILSLLNVFSLIWLFLRSAEGKHKSAMEMLLLEPMVMSAL